MGLSDVELRDWHVSAQGWRKRFGPIIGPPSLSAGQVLNDHSPLTPQKMTIPSFGSVSHGTVSVVL